MSLQMNHASSKQALVWRKANTPIACFQQKQIIQIIGRPRTNWTIHRRGTSRGYDFLSQAFILIFQRQQMTFYLFCNFKPRSFGHGRHPAIARQASKIQRLVVSWNDPPVEMRAGRNLAMEMTHITSPVSGWDSEHSLQGCLDLSDDP